MVVECFKLGLGVHGGEDSHWDLQGFDTDRLLPRFQMNILPPFSG